MEVGSELFDRTIGIYYHYFIKEGQMEKNKKFFLGNVDVRLLPAIFASDYDGDPTAAAMAVMAIARKQDKQKKKD